MDEKDRMFAAMSENNRINQAKQLALMVAKVAVLKVGISGKGLLGSIGEGVQKGSNIAGTTFDVAGRETAKQAAAKASLESVKNKATTTLMTGKAKEVVKKVEETVSKKMKKIPTKEIKYMMKEGTMDSAKKEVKKAASKAPGTSAALNTIDKGKAFLSNASQGLNTFKSIHLGDPNGVINFTSGLLLGEWNLTNGNINFANNVLKGKVKPGKATLKAQDFVLEMTGKEAQINTLVKNNLDILKKEGVKIPQKKLSTKHEQDAFMSKDVPKEILEKTAWSKNLEDYNSLRKEVNQLGSKVRAINRGGFNINEEKERLREITDQQELKYEQLKTLAADEDPMGMLKGKSAEEVMTKNFVIAMNFQNLENKAEAFKLVNDFQAMNNRKTLIINDCQAQIKEGIDYLDNSVARTTSDLLKDTRRLLTNANKDAIRDTGEDSEF